VTFADLIGALREHDAMLYVDGAGALRYVGPRLAAEDPIRRAIAEHDSLLLELCTYAPGGRCAAADCYRLRASSSETCAGPHLVLDLALDRVTLEAA